MSSLPSSVAAQPTAEVVPITKMFTDTFTKDPVFLVNAVIAGLAILYYLICGSWRRLIYKKQTYR